METYFVSFLVEEELEQWKPRTEEIGIDLGYLIQNINNKQRQQRLYFFTLYKYLSIQKLTYTMI